MTDNSREALLPCPFCGDYPSYGTRVNGASPSNYCYCPKCMNPKYFELINDAIDSWNTRAKADSAPKLTEEDEFKAENKKLRDALEFYANKANWFMFDVGGRGKYWTALNNEDGKIAREALKTEGE